MAQATYSKALCAELAKTAFDPGLSVARKPSRYEVGEWLELGIEDLAGTAAGRSSWLVERFLGGGFAGQVYCCRLERIEGLAPDRLPGLAPGRRYAVKILVPPSSFSRRFRNLLFRLAFQGPFAPQVNRTACRAGALWQAVIRRAARVRFGRDTAVKDVYALLHDPRIRAWGEVTEWIEGRTWRLESDDRPGLRRHWRTLRLEDTQSPEYVAKRRFMAEFVALLHELGAAELARQFTWATGKSQPNVLLRTDGEAPPHPERSLCAIDFRAGLALLPFLPMSPGDVPLILRGLFRRGALVQFDRGDFRRLDDFVAQHADAFAGLAPLLEALRRADRAYRRALPDLTHHGLRPLFDAALRRDVRGGLVDGYLADDLVDEAFADRLRAGGARFAAFYLLGAVPLLGRLVRHRWGHAAYRRHLRGMFTSPAYLARTARSHAAHRLIAWHRAGRAGEGHARRLARHPALFFAERFTLGWLPAGLHRFFVDPMPSFRAVGDFFRFLREFMRSESARERWFLGLIADGEKDGMLTPEEADRIRRRVREPFIVKYLKCLGVHLATLPVTQVVSVLVGAAWAGWLLAHGHGWETALGAFAATIAVFQVTPVSPGSLCRGAYVVYLMVRERNVRDYVVAAPLSFVKYIGYLAFPLQMTTTYPHLARFMAARWATGAVRVVPVFGEKGALLEHAVFDLFFNVPQVLGRWIRPRIRGLLDAWLALGVALAASLFLWKHIDPGGKAGVNILIATAALFILPRLLFYPLLARRRRGGGAGNSEQ